MIPTVVRFILLSAALAMAACAKDSSEAPRTRSTPAPDTGKTRPPPDEPKPDEPEPVPEPEPDEPDEPRAACDTLDRSECLSALHCTMHFVKNNRYECRPAAGACETDLRQTDPAACRAREGCTWSPGSCYCNYPGYGQTQVPDKQKNPGGACACGGGPPPICKAGS